MSAFDRAIAFAAVVSLACIAACTRTGDEPLNGNGQATSRNASIARSDLPPLQLGSGKAVTQLLDELYRKEGLPAVVKWAEQELTPGREIVYQGRIGDEVERRKIYDRSIWLLNDDGEITSRAVLAPLTDEKYGESEFFANWSRPRNREPFVLRLRIWRD
ncbi:hypothetical protein SAMN06265795_11196 [Noviherbaspirillum humi]|uniref:Beta-barrel assembly machine subunit BamE n=1 Tax=Noviherbaspirillum humi TaxID=1688639 RepID=A0A239J353_9BURK|nr:hypothetical protein [Noviherbaspirillum humi]SNT00229.1 hypothetical protein SAMN06265795_11196 [Noviherbaspirillum humi]